ncbi:MAG: diversity-generating retroelement protein Avd, partial [Planctomycetes bacterium]|nr:diversity-generating retroelement protein Avd [Planctomycetota bacterium]
STPRSSPPHGEAAGALSPGGPGRPEVVEHAHALLAWALPMLGKFPRQHRFVLGDRMAQRLYHLLELLVRATYASRQAKRELLGAANVEIEVFRHELRIANAQQLVTVAQVEHATRLLDGVGRQVGGWRRALA